MYYMNNYWEWQNRFGNNFTDNPGELHKDMMQSKNIETGGAYQASVSGNYGEFTVSSVLNSLPDEYAVMNDILLQQGNMLRPYNNMTIAKYGPAKFKVVRKKGKYYEVVPKSTQIDHVVVSPYGVFVIETKNHKGFIVGDPNGKVWTQILNKGKFTFYNPVTQNMGHIRELCKQTGVPFNCMAGMVVFSNPEAVLGNVQCGCCFTLDMLYQSILSYTNVIWSDRQVHEIIKRIDKLNTNGYLKAKEHMMYVQDIQHRHEVNKRIAMNRG